MTFDVQVSRTFEKAYRRLDRNLQRRVRNALERLREDPRSPRPGADIKLLHGTDPLKHRLRVGDYRVVFVVDGRRVLVLDVFPRGKGYADW